MDKRRLLIADSSEDFLQALTEALCQDYRILCCQDGREALTLISSFQPHLFLLDPMLPSLDGISLLEAAVAAGQTPIVMTVCSHYTEYMTHALYRLKVGYLIRKPCDIHALVDRIRDLDHQSEQPFRSAPDPQHRTGELLLTMGFVPKHRGYAYLCCAIVAAAHQPDQSITKELYPRIAATFNCEQASVEHSIRTAIEAAWKKGSRESWLQYFPPELGYSANRPTNHNFITRMAGVIRSDPAMQVCFPTNGHILG